jgi:hypothetical protein
MTDATISKGKYQHLHFLLQSEADGCSQTVYEVSV